MSIQPVIQVIARGEGASTIWHVPARGETPSEVCTNARADVTDQLKQDKKPPRVVLAVIQGGKTA